MEHDTPPKFSWRWAFITVGLLVLLVLVVAFQVIVSGKTLTDFAGDVSQQGTTTVSDPF